MMTTMLPLLKSLVWICNSEVGQYHAHCCMFRDMDACYILPTKKVHCVYFRVVKLTVIGRQYQEQTSIQQQRIDDIYLHIEHKQTEKYNQTMRENCETRN